jgi:lipid-A-disaccharide synthase
MTSRLKGRYVISAGELSGDRIAADFVLAWAKAFPDHRAYGVAGPYMIKAGVKALAPMDAFSLMGIGEILTQLPTLAKVEKKLYHEIEQLQPDFVVCIDSFGLHARLAQRLAALEIPCYQYVAPKLWAWGRWRVAGLRKYFKRCFGILDFEAEFFRKENVDYEYVGSPHWNRMPQGEKLRTYPSLEHPTIALLPGSRRSEVNLIWPSLLEVKAALAKRLPKAKFVVPVAESLKDLSLIQPEDGLEIVFSTQRSSLEVMAEADLAILASGTASLECAMVGTPMIVVYKMSLINSLLAKSFVKLPYVSLVNLIFNEQLVSEYLQNIDVDKIVEESLLLLTDPSRQISKFKELPTRLPPHPELKVMASILGDFK